LRFGVDIEGYPFDDFANSILEPSPVIEYNQGVERVYQREREVPRNVVVYKVLT
jgi:hypothetical protein